MKTCSPLKRTILNRIKDRRLGRLFLWLNEDEGQSLLRLWDCRFPSLKGLPGTPNTLVGPTEAITWPLLTDCPNSDCEIRGYMRVVKRIITASNSNSKTISSIKSSRSYNAIRKRNNISSARELRYQYQNETKVCLSQDDAWYRI